MQKLKNKNKKQTKKSVLPTYEFSEIYRSVCSTSTKELTRKHLLTKERWREFIVH